MIPGRPYARYQPRIQHLVVQEPICQPGVLIFSVDDRFLKLQHHTVFLLIDIWFAPHQQGHQTQSGPQ